MNIDKKGGGKSCGKCREQQNKDTKLWIGLTQIEAAHGLRREANDPTENKKVRGKTI